MKRIIFLFFLGSIFSFQLKAQKDLPVFAQHGECHLNVGKCHNVIIKDSLAFFGTEAGLLILNTSNPDSPEFVSCYYTEKLGYKIFIADTFAVVTEFASGYPIVSFVNIKEPYNPTLIHAFEISQFEVHSIFIQESLMFLGNGYYGLNIYDISDFYDPVLTTILPDIDPDDMIVRDSLIYMTAYNMFFGIIDISVLNEPEVLCWLGDYTTSRRAIDLKEDYVYLAGKTLEVFDIANPINPEKIVDVELVSDWLRDICVEGNNCFTLSEDSLFVLNIEDPENPIVMDEYIYKASYLDFQDDILIVSKDYDYDNPIGIGVFNLEENQQIEIAYEYLTDKAKDVYLHGDYVYVANGFSGLRIIDISNPANPQIVSDCLQGHCVIELLVENNIAYVRTHDGFKIVDVDNPGIPIVLGEYTFPYFWSTDALCAIEKYGNYIYIGGEGFWEVFVFDISDLSNPVNVEQFPVNDWCPDLAIFDDHLYATGYWGGLMIFDLSNPVFPPIAGSYPMAMSSRIAVGEDMAFVTGVVDPNGNGGIEIFDLTDLNNPIHAGTYELGVNDIQCLDQYLFIAHRDYQDINSSIRIVDMTDIYNPLVVQEILDVKPNGILCKGDNLVAVEDFKFKIFGDSLTVSSQDIQIEKTDIELSCYPNPASSEITIKFNLENDGKVELTVFNIRGELVKILVSDDFGAGKQNINWNLENQSGNKLTNGIYFIKLLTNNNYNSSLKIIINNNG